MKSNKASFLNDLIMYDYMLFGGAFVVFVFFIIIGLLLRKKMALAIFFIVFGFLTLILAPTIGYKKMHEFIFKNTTTITTQKRLQFTDAIVLKGNLTNTSKVNFKSCRIIASVHKVSKNEIKTFLFKYKTLKKGSVVEKDIQKGETREFKIIIEPFTYSKSYDVTVKAKCK